MNKYLITGFVDEWKKNAQVSIPILLAHLKAAKHVYNPQIEIFKKLIRALIRKKKQVNATNINPGLLG